MKRFSMWMMVAALFCGVAMLGRARGDDKPDGPPPRQEGGRGGPGGPGGGRGGPGGPPPGGIHLIPRFAMEKINLTEDQKKQVADLEKECKEKLAKILTPEQMKTLETARPPQRGGPGGPENGGRGGPNGGGGRGGPGAGPGGPGPGGPPGNEPDSKPRPPQN